VVCEEISRADSGLRALFSLQAMTVPYTMMEWGGPEVRGRYVEDLVQGKTLGCTCFSEPNAGSDISAVQTKAAKDGDSYFLTGNKIWLSHGGAGGTYITLAITDKEKGPRGLSAFVIDPDIAKNGMEVIRIEEKLGLHASITAQIALNNCEVPAENLLGTEGDGLRLVLGSLSSSRIGIAAQSTGISETALQHAINYSSQRVQFGRPIAKHQAISFKLAEMATKVHNNRLLYLNCAQMKHNGEDTRVESSFAKLYGTEIAQQVTYDAIQIHGGYGYSREYDVERLFRDARVLTIYEGTSEMQRTIIGRAQLDRAQ